jgi:hypothetical protein
MEKVVGFCVKAGIVPQPPAVAFGPATGGAKAALRFDASYIDAVVAKSK